MPKPLPTFVLMGQGMGLLCNIKVQEAFENLASCLNIQLQGDFLDLEEKLETILEYALESQFTINALTNKLSDEIKQRIPFNRNIFDVNEDEKMLTFYVICFIWFYRKLKKEMPGEPKTILIERKMCELLEYVDSEFLDECKETEIIGEIYIELES